MRIIVNESQYKSILKTQQSNIKLIENWATFILEKMLLNTTGENGEVIIVENNLRNKLNRNNFYKHLPLNKVIMNIVEGSENKWNYKVNTLLVENEEDFKGHTVEIEYMRPKGEKILKENIIIILNEIYNTLLSEQQKYAPAILASGVDIGNWVGEIGTLNRHHVFLTKNPIMISGVTDNMIIVSKENLNNQDEIDKFKDIIGKIYTEGNWPGGGHIKSIEETPNTINFIFDETSDQEVYDYYEDKKEDGSKPNIDLSTIYYPILSSGYKKRMHPIKKKMLMHWGADYIVPQNSQLTILKKGVVKDAKIKNDDCGGTLKIVMDDGNSIRFCHLSDIKVKKGDKISEGQIVALTGGQSGSTGAGSSTGPHVHFEYKPNNTGNPIDPIKYANIYWGIKK